MVDLNKLSADVRTRIEGIMGMEHDAKKIDSQKEYQELGKLLCGDGKVTGKQKEIIEGMLVDYQDTYMVRDEVKQRVQDLVKNGNEITADDQAEIHNLKQYKKTKGLSKEEKAFIQRVIDGKEVNTGEKADAGTKAQKSEQNDTNPTPSKENTKPQQNDTPSINNGIGTENPKKNTAPKKKVPEKGAEVASGKDEESKPYPKEKTNPKPNVNNNNTYNPINTPVNQSGEGNISVRGDGNTVIINGADKTEGVNEPSQTEPTSAPKETNETKKPTQKQLETLSNQIFDAINGAGTKDRQLQNALKQITKDNILELLETYNAKHPDMFENVLDDLSRSDYTFAVNVFKNALLERGGNDPKLSRCAGEIDNELKSSWRSDETIVNNLHEMVRHIQKKEQEV